MAMKTLKIAIILALAVGMVGFGGLVGSAGDGINQDARVPLGVGITTMAGNGHQGEGSGDCINQDWGGPNGPNGNGITPQAGNGHQGEGSGDGINQDWGGPNGPNGDGMTPQAGNGHQGEGSGDGINQVWGGPNGPNSPNGT